MTRKTQAVLITSWLLTCGASFVAGEQLEKERSAESASALVRTDTEKNLRASEMLDAINRDFEAADGRTHSMFSLNLHVRRRDDTTMSSYRHLEVPRGAKINFRRLTPEEGGRTYGVIVSVTHGGKELGALFIALGEDSWEFTN